MQSLLRVSYDTTALTLVSTKPSKSARPNEGRETLSRVTQADMSDNAEQIHIIKVHANTHGFTPFYHLLSTPHFHNGQDRKTQFCGQSVLMASDPAKHDAEQQLQRQPTELMALWGHGAEHSIKRACIRFVPLMHPASGKCLQARLCLFPSALLEHIRALAFTSLAGLVGSEPPQSVILQMRIRVSFSAALLAILRPRDA